MSTRDGFLAALRAAPDDVALRLVFADWLEDHDDPLGEYVRLQCRRAELDPDDPAADELRRRERDLEAVHGDDWFGPLAGWVDRVGMFAAGTRRGFIEEVCCPLEYFVEDAAAVRHECPALTRLVLFAGRHRGHQLAACADLAGVLRELSLSGWLTGDDLAALARSPHLGDLRRLQLWLGEPTDEETLAVLPGVSRLPALQELVLLHPTFGPASAAVEFLATAMTTLGAPPHVRVEDGSTFRFALRGWAGHGFLAGTLGDGRAVLVYLYGPDGQELVVQAFTADGEPDEVTSFLHEYSGLPDPIEPESRPYQAAVEHYLGEQLGFTPGLIRVRVLRLAPGDGDVSAHVYEEDQEDRVLAHDAESNAATHDWIEHGSYWLEAGNSYIVADGKIVAS